MRRIAMVVVLVSLASAQVARPGRGRGVARENVPGEGPSAASLLQVVHEDAQQLAPTDRAAVLSRAIQTAQRVQPDQVLPWTEELFNLASQIAEDRRATPARAHGPAQPGDARFRQRSSLLRREQRLQRVLGRPRAALPPRRRRRPRWRRRKRSACRAPESGTNE